MHEPTEPTQSDTLRAAWRAGLILLPCLGANCRDRLKAPSAPAAPPSCGAQLPVVLGAICLLLLAPIRAQTPLNPALAPGQNFNLGRWNLQLPTSASLDPGGTMSLHVGVDQVSGSSLATYTSAFFYTNPGDGAMRFFAPITGDTTSGSEYPRSELRETYSAVQNDWFDTYGTAELDASLKVFQVPSTGKVVIGQIHGDVTSDVMTILEYGSGNIYADINFSPLVDQQVRLTFANVGLPTSGLITYQLKMVPGAVFATVNGVTQAMVVDQTAATGWPTYPLYFKAGDYCQGNPTTEGANPPANDGASTAFYSLKVTHVSSGLQVTTSSLPAAGQGAAYSQTLTAVNGSGSLTWSLVTGVIGLTGGGSIPIGSLPPGLTLGSNGVISGYVSAAVATGTYGNIVVQVTDATGATAVQTLSLAVGPGTARLTNLSILTTLATGGETFTMGFVVGGASGTKQLLARAAGPSLVPLGVTGVLADPSLQFYAGSTLAGQNDNWGTPVGPGAASAAQIAAVISQVGAFAFLPNSPDAAALDTASAGSNSVIVSGVNGATGTVIAELYDATPATLVTATTPRLINVSVLKEIGTGLTAGFVIYGTGSETVLIRGVGPTLGAAPFNIAGVVADPQLTLFASNQTAIGSNNDWGTPVGTGAATAAQLSAAVAKVGAFALTTGSKDAALLATLAPGGYTVLVTGANNTSGVALIEVYEVR